MLWCMHVTNTTAGGAGMGGGRRDSDFQTQFGRRSGRLDEADPLLKAGRLTLELHSWFAGAGLRVNRPKGMR